MGLLETLFEHVSPKATVGILFIAYIVYTITWRVNEHRRIRRLGNYGPFITYRLPWG